MNRNPGGDLRCCLVTGAAGIVGTAIRPFLARRYESVLLTDIAEVTELSENERYQRGNIADAEFLCDFAATADCVVHLAGLVGPQYTLDEVLQPNIVGTYNVFQAARKAGIRQLVYASSHHAVGFARRGTLIDDSMAPRPDSVYGLSKAFGESTAYYFADKYDLNVLVIRIGFVGDRVSDERRLHTWISARDLFQLIEIGLRTADLGCQIVYGVSENPEPFFDNRNALRLGYRPLDRAIDYLAEPALMDALPNRSSRAGLCIGGYFVDSDCDKMP